MPYKHPLATNAQHAPLHDYQRTICNFAIEHPRCGLFLPLGLGKTLITLETLYELNPRTHVLIIGPKPVVRSTWTDEIQKWNFPFRINSLIVNEKGRNLTAAARHALYHDIVNSHTSSIWLINRELVVDLVQNLPKDKKNQPIWPFGMVIIDEAQSFKSYKAKRFKNLQLVSPQIQRLIELSGTPRPNSIEDLWPLVYLLDHGQRLGPNITTFRMNYMFPVGRSSTGHPICYVPRAGSEALINSLISDITVSLPDVLVKLPPVTFDDRTIQLSEDERKLYKEMVKESVLQFEDGDEVVAANAAILQAKLSQLASGAIYVNGTHEYRKIHERKLEETLRIVEDAGSPVIVAYHFRSDRDMLVEYLRHHLDPPALQKEKLTLSDQRSRVQVYDGSPEMIHRWNEGKIDVFMIQPASAGHGLNLQAGGHTLVWYTLPWSLEHYLQTNGRIYRQGQKEPVFIHRLLVEATVDQKILAALHKKDLSERALLNAVSLTIEEASD